MIEELIERILSTEEPETENQHNEQTNNQGRNGGTGRTTM